MLENLNYIHNAILNTYFSHHKSYGLKIMAIAKAQKLKFCT